MRMHTLPIVAVGAFCGVALGEIQFQVLDSLPFDTAATGVSGLSADGRVAVGMCFDPRAAIPEDPTRREAILWTASEGTVPLRPFVDVRYPSSASATSADGSVIVGNANFPGIAYDKAFRWTALGGMVPLGDLGGPEPFSRARGLSGDGRVVVGYARSTRGDEAFRWTAEEGMVAMGGFAGQPAYSEANDASSDGSVIVGRAYPYGAFRWTQNTGMQSLGHLPGGGVFSEARAVNASGTVVVGRSESALGMEAFRWENDAMIGLGDLPGGSFYSYASDVSHDGSIVVGWSTTGAGPQDEAFIWDARCGMRSLRDMLMQDYGIDVSAWMLSYATAVSADGSVIAGSGSDPSNGRPCAWVVRLPEPSSSALLAVAGTVIVASTRRRIARRPSRTGR